jgi:DNA ligase (NAD+)
MPTTCPVCGTEVFREPDEAVARCMNVDCPAQLREHLRHFASRRAMDIEGFGEQLTNQLVDRQKVVDVADIYELELEQLLVLDRMGEVLGRKILRNIEASKTRPVHRLMHALGVRHVGEHIAEVLARRFRGLPALMDAGLEELTGVCEIGPEIARSVHFFFHQQKNRELVERLIALGLRVEEDAAEESGDGAAQSVRPFEGKTFVFTGKLVSRTREEGEALVKALGGRAASSVSAKTDYVVAGEAAGSKLDRARALQVAIISEQDFDQMVASLSSA